MTPMPRSSSSCTSCQRCGFRLPGGLSWASPSIRQTCGFRRSSAATSMTSRAVGTTSSRLTISERAPRLAVRPPRRPGRALSAAVPLRTCGTICPREAHTPGTPSAARGIPAARPPRRGAAARPDLACSCPFSSPRWHRPIQCEIQLQHVDPRLPENSELSPGRVCLDELPDGGLADAARRRHPRRLRFRRRRADIGIEPAARRSHQVRRDGTGKRRVFRAESLHVRVHPIDELAVRRPQIRASRRQSIVASPAGRENTPVA